MRRATRNSRRQVLSEGGGILASLSNNHGDSYHETVTTKKIDPTSPPKSLLISKVLAAADDESDGMSSLDDSVQNESMEEEDDSDTEEEEEEEEEEGEFSEDEQGECKEAVEVEYSDVENDDTISLDGVLDEEESDDEYDPSTDEDDEDTEDELERTEYEEDELAMKVSGKKKQEEANNSSNKTTEGQSKSGSRKKKTLAAEDIAEADLLPEEDICTKKDSELRAVDDENGDTRPTKQRSKAAKKKNADEKPPSISIDAMAAEEEHTLVEDAGKQNEGIDDIERMSFQSKRIGGSLNVECELVVAEILSDDEDSNDVELVAAVVEDDECTDGEETPIFDDDGCLESSNISMDVNDNSGNVANEMEDTAVDNDQFKSPDANFTEDGHIDGHDSSLSVQGGEAFPEPTASTFPDSSTCNSGNVANEMEDAAVDHNQVKSPDANFAEDGHIDGHESFSAQGGEAFLKPTASTVPDSSTCDSGNVANEMEDAAVDHDQLKSPDANFTEDGHIGGHDSSLSGQGGEAFPEPPAASTVPDSSTCDDRSRTAANIGCGHITTRSCEKRSSPKTVRQDAECRSQSFGNISCVGFEKETGGDMKNDEMSAVGSVAKVMGKKAANTDFESNNSCMNRRQWYRREGSVRRGQWTLGSKIGIGAFGVVHVGMNTQTGTLMAVKIVKMEQAAMKDVRREIHVLKSLQHKNIVRYYGAEMDETHLHIFQEWVAGGSVTGMLAKFGPFSVAVIRSYLSQLLEGLIYLHDSAIMHRDIKGSNILVSDAGIVKLADFGASKKLRSDMMLTHTMRGTPYFMAPEVFEEKYSFEADIWSVGCVAIQMASGSPPWKSLALTNPVALFNHVKRQNGPPHIDIPSSSDREDKEIASFKSLVAKCFQKVPSDRPSAEELLRDSFFLEAQYLSDDDRSVNQGLFSPSSTCSWENLGSPIIATLSPIPRPLRRSNSISSPRRSPFLSPPLPRRSITRASSPMRSPQFDTTDWPTWAREKQEPNLPSESRTNVPISRCEKEAVDMMESLALSEDTLPVDCNVEDREISGRCSSDRSPLLGLLFLGSSEN